MSKQEPIFIVLPYRTPSVTLPYEQGRILGLIIGAREGGISANQLVKAGCISPRSEISKLRERGALIATQVSYIAVAYSEINPPIVHYIYQGWGNDVYRTLNEK